MKFKKIYAELNEAFFNKLNDRDYMSIADALVNAWETMDVEEMIDHLYKDVVGVSPKRIDPVAIQFLVQKWYDDLSLRRKMDTANKATWLKFLKKQMTDTTPYE